VANVKFSNGEQTMVLSKEDFVAYMANLSDAGRRRIKVDGKHDAVYQNTDGELVREGLEGDQLVARMGMGENAFVMGPDDPKLQAQMRQQADAARLATAKDHKILTLASGIAPVEGLARTFMDKDVVDQGFGELKQANSITKMAGEFVPALYAGGAAMKGLNALGLTAKSGKGLGLLAHVAVDEAAFETVSYTKYIMDTRQDFQAEQLGENILQGMLFAAPIIGGAMLRKPIWNAVSMVGGGVGKASAWAQSGMVAASLKTTDAGKASKLRRGAAIAGIGRRLFGGRKTVTKVDELAELRKTMGKEELDIGRATPEGLKGTKGTVRERILKTIKDNMEMKAGYLDEVDVGTVAPNLNKVRTAGRQAQNSIWSINRTMRGDAVIGVGNLGKTQTDLLESAMDTFLGRADDMGLGDIVGHLRDVKGHKNYGILFQARLDLALKGKVGNQSTELLAMELKAITEDPRIWGSSKAMEQSRNLNTGIDKLTEGFEQLKKLDIPDDLSKIPENTNLDALDDALASIRHGYDNLHASKLFSTKQVRGIESTLNKVEDALVEGKKAYLDAVKVNKARQSAAKVHKARYDKLKGGDVETVGALESRMTTRVAEWAEERTGLIKHLSALSKSNRIPIHANRMLRMLRETTMAEKEEFFLEMQERIPMMTSNPEIMAKEMEPFMAEAPQQPGVHAMAGVVAANSVYMLSNKLGRVDRTLHGKGRTPRRDRVIRFAETYAAMASPMDVAYAATEGKVTQDMIDAIRVSAPAQYAELGALFSQFIDTVDIHTLSRSTVKGVLKFMGGGDPLFQGEVIMQLQSNYAQNAEQQEAVGGQQPMPNGQQFNQSHPQDGDNAFTFTQRVQSY